MSTFVHLRVHSAYSLAKGAIKIKDIPKLCAQFKQPAIAITDNNNLFGALEFATQCANNGVQPIIGCELQVKYQDTIGQLILLAESEIGYKNLMVHVSRLYTDNVHENGTLFLNLESLENATDGLIALTSFTNGIWGKLLTKELYEEADATLLKLQQLFPNNLYVEIQRHGINSANKIEEIMVEKAFAHNLPLVATNNVFFPDPSYYEAHDALLCIAGGHYIVQEERPKITPHHFLKSTEEMVELFKDMPEAIINTVNIAKRCAFMPVMHSPILPKFPTDDGLSEEAELIKQAQNGLKQRLDTEVFNRFPKEQHEAIIKEYETRLEYEISIIKQMGFCGYFLIVADFIKWAKSQNIPVGPGRGSGAGSLVAWSLTITDMDPIRFGLIFERFLNPERVSMPDFDIDFCQDRRDEVIRYVQSKYGDDKVAHIITFGKLQARAVLRDVGRVMQIPYPVVDRICKMIPNNPANPVTLEQALEIEPAMLKACEEDESIAKMVAIGKKLEGLYRHASTHAAGVVIGDRPLTELVPLFKDESSALAATQFNMKYVELAGLVKFDFLGLKTLSIIEHASEIVRQTIPDFNIQKIPLDDLKTFELLTNVNVVGIFQLESAGMRDVLRKLKPDRLEDLIALVALYRPGPMDDIPRYLACKHGQEKVTYLHPALQPILEPTYGVMVYQEQVMQIAQVLGGYTLGAADLLRRAMGKKIKAEMDAQQEMFISGAVGNGVNPKIASQIFDLMAKFAGYGFNKSHSAPYGLLAYQTAYLKANFPVAFFAASMTADMHNTDKINAYRQDMEKMSISLLPPDINHSFATFVNEGNAVRFGLAAIKNVGPQAIDGISESRKVAKFTSLNDFIEKVDAKNLNKRLMENLIAAGTFDCLHNNRRSLYESVETITNLATQKNQPHSKQTSLFGSTASAIKIDFKIPEKPEWNGLAKLQKEFDALGFYLSDHPLRAYHDQLDKLNIVVSSKLESINASAIRMAGVVLSTTVRTGKNGQKYAFLNLSDQDGAYEVTLFSEVYSKHLELINAGSLIAVEANIKKDNEQIRLTANKIYKLDELQPFTKLNLKIPANKPIHGLLEDIKELPVGSCEINLEISAEIIGIPTTISLGKKAINAHVYHQLIAWCA
jgi:DNA polymerase-3 subunit alpha